MALRFRLTTDLPSEYRSIILHLNRGIVYAGTINLSGQWRVNLFPLIASFQSSLSAINRSYGAVIIFTLMLFS